MRIKAASCGQHSAVINRRERDIRVPDGAGQSKSAPLLDMTFVYQ